MNITVRVGGIINNTQTVEKFLEITQELFGEGHTVDEYIDLFNKSARAQHSMITVHREVPDDAAVIKAKEEVDRKAEEEAEFEDEAGDYFDGADDSNLNELEKELEEANIVTFVDPEQDPQPFLDKLDEALERG